MGVDADISGVVGPPDDYSSSSGSTNTNSSVSPNTNSRNGKVDFINSNTTSEKRGSTSTAVHDDGGLPLATPEEMVELNELVTKWAGQWTLAPSTPTSGFFKFNCCLSLDTAESSPLGVFIHLPSFQTFGFDFLPLAIRLLPPTDPRGCVFVNVKGQQQQLLPANDTDITKVYKMGIGVERGFSGTRKNIFYQYSLIFVRSSSSSSLLSLPPPPSPQLSYCPTYPPPSSGTPSTLPFDAVLVAPSLLLCKAGKEFLHNVEKYEGLAFREETEKWEEEIKPSHYAQDLKQIENPPTIPPSSWRCAVCGAKDNLWLNLSDGYVGCGRKIYSVGGGCYDGQQEGAALVHFQSTGFPLVVKLGTITPLSADVFSYAKDEDDRVVDQKLADHLAYFGINIQKLEKTERSTVELEIERNQKYDWSKVTEEDSELVALAGRGHIGLANLGNSCYMNVVLQMLTCVKEMYSKFARHHLSLLYDLQQKEGGDAMRGVADGPYADSLLLQWLALCSALLTDRYPNQRKTTAQDQYVTPQAFKRVVARGHTEFSSGRQQDCEEFLSYFLKKLAQLEGRGGCSQLPPVMASATGGTFCNLFRFEMDQRFECLQSNKVRYISVADVCILSLDLPREPTTHEQQAKKLKGDLQSATSEQSNETNNRPQITFKSCLDKWSATTYLDGYISPATNTAGRAATSQRFRSFPAYLFVHLKRFYAAPDWTAAKVDALVQVPELLDLEYLRSKGRGKDEVELENPQNGCPSWRPEVITAITNMGFSENAARRACLANPPTSSPEACVEWILERMGDYNLNDPPSPSSNTWEGGAAVDNTLVDALTGMGFDAHHARAALIATGNSADRAAEWLFSHAENLDQETQNILGKVGQKTNMENPRQLRDERPDGEGKYELLAFATHMGRNANCGHYVCHLKRNGRWTIVNDAKVAESKTPPFDLGYLYLFKRIDWTHKD